MMPVEQFDQLVNRSRQPEPGPFFRESPLVGLELDWKRDRGYGARYRSVKGLSAGHQLRFRTCPYRARATRDGMDGGYG